MLVKQVYDDKIYKKRSMIYYKKKRKQWMLKILDNSKSGK